MHARTEVLLLALLGLTADGIAAQVRKAADGDGAAVRSESPTVVIDTIVTDKKGDYIHDLVPTEFHVWQGNKEQAIKRVSHEFPVVSNASYTVLFFGRIPVGDQPYAREVAAKVIEATAAPGRQIAILNYLGSGGTKVIQNFTTDAERLMGAAKNMEVSSVYIESGTTGTSAAYDVRSHLRALVGVAKTLGSLPGRKSIVVLAPTINYDVQVRTDPGSVGAGTINSSITAPEAPSVSYYVQPEDMSAAISACNKANVTLYLIDVRVDQTPVENQLSPLAAATGGLSIDNSRNALNGLRKIAQDQQERYFIEYFPSQPAEERCHPIKVKVDRGGAIVRSRSMYCDIDPRDPLAGTQIGRDLEARATGSSAGGMAAQIQSPFFYTAPNRARVHITAEVAAGGMNFVKQNGKFHASLNVLGIAYTSEGQVGARFSDTVEFDYQTKKDVEQFKQVPFRYENDLPIPAGQYELKLVFSPDRDNFAKTETPLVIEPWDGERFALSGVALSRESRPVSGTERIDASLAGDHAPLVSRGLQFVPTGNNRFRTKDPAMLYVEIYEPLLRNPDPPKVLIQLMVLDRKNGVIKLDSGRLDMTSRILPGNPVVPVGLKIPLDSLTPGAYAVVLKASDSSGNVSLVRHAEFEVE